MSVRCLTNGHMSEVRLTNTEQIKEMKHLEYAIQRYEFRYIRSRLDECGLYKGDPRLLMAIAKEEGSSQAQLAKSLCIKPATLTVMIQRMEAAELIKRKPDEKDLRTLRVFITDKGKGIETKTQEVFKKSLPEIYNGISSEELQLYISVASKIKSNLESLTEHIPKELFDMRLPN